MIKRYIEFFEDECKSLSMARLIVFILVCFYVSSAIYIAFNKQEIPDVPIQLVGLITVLYGINKVAPNLSMNIGNNMTQITSKKKVINEEKNNGN